MTVELNDDATKLIMTCDFHKGKPKSISSATDDIEYVSLVDKAHEAGWFMRRKDPDAKHSDWIYCCPDCAATRLESGDVDQIAEISSVRFAKAYVRDHE